MMSLFGLAYGVRTINICLITLRRVRNNRPISYFISYITLYNFIFWLSKLFAMDFSTLFGAIFLQFMMIPVLSAHEMRPKSIRILEISSPIFLLRKPCRQCLQLLPGLWLELAGPPFSTRRQ